MKRIFALLLAGALWTSACLWTAGYSVPQKIKSLHPQFAQQLTTAEIDGQPIEIEQLQSLEVWAGAELRVYFSGRDGSLFLDQNGSPIPTADVTLSRLRAAQVTVSAPEDMDGIVESVQFAYGRGGQLASASPYLLIRFVERFASVEEVSFSFPVTLSVAGQPQEQTTLELSGVMKIAETNVFSAAETDISDGAVACSTGDISNAVLKIGEGVTITARLEEGGRYYGVASLEERDTAKEGEILMICTLYTVNLEAPGTTVRIGADATLHVYNEQGDYLGTTRDALPYSDRYYLTNQKMQNYLP